MFRRQFITACGAALVGPSRAEEQTLQRIGVPLDQEPLAYDFKALEPHIDALTMELHYKMHHASYVENLHRALASVHLEAASVSSLLRTLDVLTPQGGGTMLRLGRKNETLPEGVKRSIRDNGGGHFNHTLFWRYMVPPNTVPPGPQGKFLAALQKAFGGLEEFKKAFASAAMKHFGSGWVWLSYRSDGVLYISTTPNQDNPLMKSVVPAAEYGRPVLCLDLWEHAYYLKYKNSRADYIAAWWNVVNWPRAEQSYEIVTSTSG